MSAGSTLLRLWLAGRDMLPVDFARHLGISKSAVSRYLSGKRRPGAWTAHLIEVATARAVPVAAWGPPASQNHTRPEPVAPFA